MTGLSPGQFRRPFLEIFKRANCRAKAPIVWDTANHGDDERLEEIIEESRDFGGGLFEKTTWRQKEKRLDGPSRSTLRGGDE